MDTKSHGYKWDAVWDKTAKWNYLRHNNRVVAALRVEGIPAFQQQYTWRVIPWREHQPVINSQTYLVATNLDEAKALAEDKVVEWVLEGMVEL